MNGKGYHDADASILKSDNPFAWQPQRCSQTLTHPAPALWTAACLELRGTEVNSPLPKHTTQRKQSGKGLSTPGCHLHLKETVTSRSHTQYCKVGSAQLLLRCLLSTTCNWTASLGLRCTLIITVLSRSFCRTNSFLKDGINCLTFILGSCHAQKAFGYTVKKKLDLVRAKRSCLLHLFFYCHYRNRTESGHVPGA